MCRLLRSGDFATVCTYELVQYCCIPNPDSGKQGDVWLPIHKTPFLLLRSCGVRQELESRLPFV